MSFLRRQWTLFIRRTRGLMYSMGCGNGQIIERRHYDSLYRYARDRAQVTVHTVRTQCEYTVQDIVQCSTLYTVHVVIMSLINAATLSAIAHESFSAIACAIFASFVCLRFHSGEK